MSRRPQVLSVGELPMPVRASLADAANDERLGLVAAIEIARFRKRTGIGPTFSELFATLERIGSIRLNWEGEADVTFAFRYHIAVHWRRQGWVRWTLSTRSLATGRTFQAASAAHRALTRARNLRASGVDRSAELP